LIGIEADGKEFPTGARKRYNRAKDSSELGSHRNRSIETPLMVSKLPDDNTLIKLYEDQGLSMPKIGERYGVSRQRVHQRLSELGIRGRRWRSNLDPETLQQLYCLSRFSKQEIASKLGVSPHKVQRALSHYGIRRPKIAEHLASAHTREEIEQIYVTEGVHQTDAAKRLGMSLPSFKALLQHYGITHRHHGIPYSARPRGRN